MLAPEFAHLLPLRRLELREKMDGREMSRSDDLLRAAAEAFADGRNPFESSWLSEHDVTLNECMDLSDRIAAVLSGYPNAPPVVKKAFPLFVVERSPEQREHVFFRFFESQAMKSVTERLSGRG